MIDTNINLTSKTGCKDICVCWEQEECAFTFNMTNNLEEIQNVELLRLQHVAINDVTVASYHHHVMCGCGKITLHFNYLPRLYSTIMILRPLQYSTLTNICSQHCQNPKDVQPLPHQNPLVFPREVGWGDLLGFYTKTQEIMPLTM